jgi:hypothetical protein
VRSAAAHASAADWLAAGAAVHVFVAIPVHADGVVHTPLTVSISYGAQGKSAAEPLAALVVYEVVLK